MTDSPSDPEVLALSTSALDYFASVTNALSNMGPSTGLEYLRQVVAVLSELDASSEGSDGALSIEARVMLNGEPTPLLIAPAPGDAPRGEYALYVNTDGD